MTAAAEHVRLVDRRPALTAAELVQRLVPPPRFAAVRFSTYVPNPAHPSQAAALAEMEAFADAVDAGPPAAARRRWWRRAAAAEEPEGSRGRYLDGGFGVGKTHLLAALWHAVDGPAAYLSFSELTAVIGFLGMDEAVRAFSGFRLLALDEFELDDVANTLMTVTFLRSLIPHGVAVAATSNSLPDRLGEGRFNADDFHREIAAISDHFATVRLDGPDYRHREGLTARPLADAELEAVVPGLAGRVAVDGFDELLAHLRRVHPVQFRALVDGLDAVVLRGLRPIANQGEALLFVQFVDELYDAEVAVVASGCEVGELFPVAYREGGYRKKYGRCESRLASMLAETSSA